MAMTKKQIRVMKEYLDYLKDKDLKLDVFTEVSKRKLTKHNRNVGLDRVIIKKN